MRGPAGIGKRLALLLLLIASVAGVRGEAEASPPAPPFDIVDSGPRGLVLDWHVASVETYIRPDGGLGLRVPGYAQSENPGRPALPVSAHLIAVPPDAAPRLNVRVVNQTTQQLVAPLAVVPYPDLKQVDGRRLPLDATALAVPDPLPLPSIPVTLEPVGVVRGVRLMRAVFYPAIPEGTSLRLTRRLRASISWEAGESVLDPGADPVLDSVRDVVLNPEYIVAGRASGPDVTLLSGDSSGGVAYLEISEAGLYAVDYGDLEPLGFAGVDPSSVRLFRGSDEVSYEWVGDGDSAFETGEQLIFYGEPRFSRWTSVDVYRLVTGGEPRREMVARSGDPAGLQAGVTSVEKLIEENDLYMPDWFRGHLPPGRDGDRWAWTELSRSATGEAELPFDAEGADPSGAAEVTLWLIGFTDRWDREPDHRVDVSLNGDTLGRVEWDGKTAVTATFPISSSVLRTTGNTLTVTLFGIPGVSTEGCWLDAFSIRYSVVEFVAEPSAQFLGEQEQRAYTATLAHASPLRAYDVTDPLSPERCTDVAVDGNHARFGDPPSGGRHRYALTQEDHFLEPDRIRDVADPWAFAGGVEPAGADVLIVTHPDFADALTPLVALRESEGLSVAVANVIGLYDAWGDGRMDPEAIRSFVAHAYASWNPRPTFVLLVGDGSFDPRQYQAASSPIFIPPYLADVDRWAGEAAADNRYVCVDGDDALPDMLVGRLPVKTLEEAEALVDKTVAYRTDPVIDFWSRNVVLTADDPDYGGNFPEMADTKAASHVPGGYTVRRHYCTEGSPVDSDCPPSTAAAIHDALIDSWHEGALLFGFFGHSSWEQWSTSRFFHWEDVSSLHNLGKAPVVLEMTCYTSAFQRPGKTLDETLVTHPGGGAVVTWGGTGLGLVSDHGLLSDGFFDAVFLDQVDTVGEATLAGKLRLASFSPIPELLDTFVLLGDPALRFNRGIGICDVFLPTVLRRP